MSKDDAGTQPDRNVPDINHPPVQTAPSQQELFSAAAFLEIERQRIDSYNRRTEVASQAVAASNEADKRQFEFQMAKLGAEDSAAKRQDRLARLIVIGFGSFLVVIVSLFFCMAFFGSAAQSAIALQILRVLAVGGGGYGIISGMVGFFRRLMPSK